MKENKNTAYTSNNPIAAILATKSGTDFFPNYPITGESVTLDFEKNLLNKKDRFLNTDARMLAMQCLIVGAFAYEDIDALARVIKYIAAAG